MGQFDSIGLKSVGQIGLTKPERRSSTLTRTEDKKKEKPKTAAAGGGSKPPKNPPKGPTGPKNPNKSNDNENERKYTGGLSKGKASPNDARMNPRDDFKRQK